MRAYYLRGLECRVAAGLSADVRSFASLFVSGSDVAVSGRVDGQLRNTLGLAIGRQTYLAYREVLNSQRLANEGARAQPLLFASTGTKDKAASDTLYVEGLAAPNTINTMPESTLQAYADHGTPPVSLLHDDRSSDAVLRRTVARASISMGWRPSSTPTARRASSSPGTRC